MGLLINSYGATTRGTRSNMKSCLRYFLALEICAERKWNQLHAESNCEVGLPPIGKVQNCCWPYAKYNAGFIQASTGRFGRGWMLHSAYDQYWSSIVSLYLVQMVKVTSKPILGHYCYVCWGLHADIEIRMYMTAILKLIINHQPFPVYVQVSNGQGYKVTVLSQKQSWWTSRKTSILTR